jgi:hypothetical protein
MQFSFFGVQWNRVHYYWGYYWPIVPAPDDDRWWWVWSNHLLTSHLVSWAMCNYGASFGWNVSTKHRLSTTDRIAQAATPFTFIRVVVGSNISRESRGSWFFSVHPTKCWDGSAIGQAGCLRLSIEAVLVQSQFRILWFVVENFALCRFSPSTPDFLTNSPSKNCSMLICHPGAGAVGQSVTAMQSRLSLTTSVTLKVSSGMLTRSLNFLQNSLPIYKNKELRNRCLMFPSYWLANSATTLRPIQKMWLFISVILY